MSNLEFAEKFIKEMPGKLLFSLRAQKYVKDKIISDAEPLNMTENFCLYLTYSTESALYGQDSEALVMELLDSRSDLDDIRFLIEMNLKLGHNSRDRRIKGESILALAQAGNFINLKNWLKEELAEERGNSFRYPPFARKIKEALQLIPDFSEPFKLPIPSWMDERFNQ